MSEHKAIISWKSTGPDFLKGKYSREHTWTFDGGMTLAASPSPSVVPVPYSNPSHVDPEEAFVAAVSSCHMLTYLYAVGVTSKNQSGATWVSEITLNPKIAYSGERLPMPADEQRLHHLAHEQCFIANSIKSQVTVGATKQAS